MRNFLTALHCLPQTSMHTVSWTRMLLGNPGWAAFVAACVLTARSPLGAIDRVELPLFDAAVEAIPADRPQSELLFRLPEHVTFEAGTELRLILQATANLPANQFSVSLSLNGERLVTQRAGRQEVPPSETIQLTAAVPERLILASWNRVTITVLPPAAAQRDSLRGSAWLLRRADCVLSLSYSRLPIFSEFARFPATLLEEKLLHPDSGRFGPLLTIAVPPELRDVHLRGCAI